MPKNKIQFQKDLSLTDFFKSYGTEHQCHEALFRLRWPMGFECPKCGYNLFSTIKSRHLYQCKQCQHQTSVTSGTVFASIKLPLTVWFLGIYLITQSKSAISSLSLSRKLGISANAALRMKHKLHQVMKERDDSKPLWVLFSSMTLTGVARNGMVHEVDVPPVKLHFLLQLLPTLKADLFTCGLAV